jgi:hypothetical protein
MADNKPKDYQTPLGDIPLPPGPRDSILAPKPKLSDEHPKTVPVSVRYMGDTMKAINFYGQMFERGQWTEVTDPFIAKMATRNGDFDVKGKDDLNRERQQMRDRREPDRLAYIAKEEAKYLRAGHNADKVLGRD